MSVKVELVKIRTTLEFSFLQSLLWTQSYQNSIFNLAKVNWVWNFMLSWNKTLQLSLLGQLPTSTTQSKVPGNSISEFWCLGEINWVVVTLELRGGRSPRSPANIRSTVASSLGILPFWFLASDGYSIYHFGFYHFKSLREAFFPAVRQPPYFRRAVGGAFLVRYWINSIELHGKSLFWSNVSRGWCQPMQCMQIAQLRMINRLFFVKSEREKTLVKTSTYVLTKNERLSTFDEGQIKSFRTYYAE